ncbi:hypothetical protein KSP40_PGU010944 [Platanthera guangdongensis]|uniref:Uncharacterized protein n=1 Tax=Platanthera guangdongensis TaxID=2320717 RepID=A0ABR2MVG8_9ASPA
MDELRIKNCGQEAPDKTSADNARVTTGNARQVGPSAAAREDLRGNLRQCIIFVSVHFRGRGDSCMKDYVKEVGADIGEAAKMAMNLFVHTQDAINREKELMKACTDAELVAAIVGNAKITAPGLTHLKQKQKKGKKVTQSDS